MYKLYVDKNENFVCEVSVKNASLKNAFARMIVEAENLTLMFKGQIKDGKCTVPIARLRGLLDENTKGKMHLEVVVEDTYFKPWEENFIVEQHTAVKVMVNEQKQPSKPTVEVRVPSKNKIMNDKKENLVPLYELSKLCEKFEITKASLPQKKNDFRQLVNEYFSANPEYLPKQRSVLRALKYFLK